MNQIFKVEVYVDPRKEVGAEAAYEVLARANPHASELVERKLENAGVNVESMIEYFQQIGYAVAEFWHNTDDPRFQTVLKPFELRQLYLPLIYGVIFASVGNFDHGNYRYVLRAKPDNRVDKEWLLDFSAKLESLREYIKGDIGQVGNRNAKPQVSTMLTVMGQISEANRTAEMRIRDGVSYDEALSGLAVLAGLTLVEEAYRILYTGVQEVNFRSLLGTIRESSQRIGSAE
jgi:hypothetical protein